MNPMKHLKAIIFDMDGVITASMPYHFRVAPPGPHSDRGILIHFELLRYF